MHRSTQRDQIIISSWNITVNSCTVWCSQLASLWCCPPLHMPVPLALHAGRIKQHL